MIIPWHVDVPQDRHPFINWLLIISVIAAFVLQVISIEQQKDKLPAKLKEFENYSAEQVAKELGVDEQQFEEVKQRVDKAYEDFERLVPQQNNTEAFKNEAVKRSLLENYFVWGKIRPYILDGGKITGLFGHMWLHGDICIFWVICCSCGSSATPSALSSATCVICRYMLHWVCWQQLLI